VIPRLEGGRECIQVAGPGSIIPGADHQVRLFKPGHVADPARCSEEVRDGARSRSERHASSSRDTTPAIYLTGAATRKAVCVYRHWLAAGRREGSRRLADRECRRTRSRSRRRASSSDEATFSSADYLARVLTIFHPDCHLRTIEWPALMLCGPVQSAISSDGPPPRRAAGMKRLFRSSWARLISGSS
jgi:hypothetical protein